MAITVKNKLSYGLHKANMGELEGTPNNYKRHTMTVEFILDMVPGAFHKPEHLMEWIAQNPYVTTVTYDED